MKSVSGDFLTLLTRPECGGILRRVTITKSSTEYDVSQYLVRGGIGRLSYELEADFAEFRAGLVSLRFSNRKAEGATGTDNRFFNDAGTGLFDAPSAGTLTVKVELGLARLDEYVTCFEGPIDPESIRRVGDVYAECQAYDWLASLDAVNAELAADATGYPRDLRGFLWTSPADSTPTGAKRVSYRVKDEGGFGYDTVSYDGGDEVTIIAGVSLVCASRDGFTIYVTCPSSATYLPGESVDDYIVITDAGSGTRAVAYPHQNKPLEGVVDDLFDQAGMVVDYNLQTIPTLSSQYVAHYVGSIIAGTSGCFPKDLTYVGTSGGLPCVVWLLQTERGMCTEIWKATLTDSGTGVLTFSAQAIATSLQVMRLFWANNTIWVVGATDSYGWWADDEDYIYGYNLQGTLTSSTKFPTPSGGDRYRRETFYLFGDYIWHSRENDGQGTFQNGYVDSVQIQRFNTADQTFSQRGDPESLIWYFRGMHIQIYHEPPERKNGALIYDSVGDYIWVNYISYAIPDDKENGVFRVAADGTWATMYDYPVSEPDDWTFHAGASAILAERYWLDTSDSNPTWEALTECGLPRYDSYLDRVIGYLGPVPHKYDPLYYGGECIGFLPIKLANMALRKDYVHSTAFICLGQSTVFVTMDASFPLPRFFPVLAQEPLSPFVEYANFEGMSVRDAVTELAKVFNCVVQCASSSSARFWPRDNYAQSFSITSTLYARNPELSWGRNRFDAVEVKTDIDGESETSRQGDFAFGKRKYSFQSRFVPRGFGDTVAENIRAWMVTPRREWRIPGVFLIYGELLDKVTIDWPETVDTLLTGIEYDDRTAITTMKLLEIV